MSKRPKLLALGPRDADNTLILAHGAGAPMDSEFMTTFAHGLAERELRVVRFEFPYMAERRKSGRRPPDREPVLRETWLAVIAAVKADKLFIGGKSMGGRIASLIAGDAGAVRREPWRWQGTPGCSGPVESPALSQVHDWRRRRWAMRRRATMIPEPAQ